MQDGITLDQIKLEVEAIVRRIRPNLKGAIELSDRLREDLGLDSLHSMELLSALTEKYEVDVEVEQLQEVRTVGDVVSFLGQALGAQAASNAPDQSPARLESEA